MSSVPERSEIETEYTWDLSGIYTDAAEWESAYESVQEQLTDLEAYEGRVTESPSTLLELLERREEVFRTLATVSTYANLRSAEDTRDQESQHENRS
jgi:oligopeptidase F. Metallo peptidase. MEROPS family M03B